MKQITRYYHTLRYLKPIQVTNRLFRFFINPVPGNIPEVHSREKILDWICPIPKDVSFHPPDTFTFLNQTHSIRSEHDWNNFDWDKLWLYNLHYFDFLCMADAQSPQEERIKFITRWIIENPPGIGNGWEPYPLSLRIVNWIKFSMNGAQLDQSIMKSLSIQIESLHRQLEYHLLGNHLFANAKALLFGGLFFNHPRADKWLKKGVGILQKELTEQVLSDGGHFERSVMYHSIILEDILDMQNVLYTYDMNKRYSSLSELLQKTASKMIAWLHALTHPDGDICLFNDAAFKIAPKPEMLIDYAEKLGISSTHNNSAVVELKETGYIIINKKKYYCSIDTAPVGPEYIPGHAHADTLNFELSSAKKRVIVDSGTSLYGRSCERERQRGSLAHNVLTVDNADSSEVWGGFRVARRARITSLSVASSYEKIVVSASHNGYKRLKKVGIISRKWIFENDTVTIIDTCDGTGAHSIVSSLHFHPDFHICKIPGSSYSVIDKKNSELILEVTFPSGKNHFTENTTWHPEFGKAIESPVLRYKDTVSFPYSLTIILKLPS